MKAPHPAHVYMALSWAFQKAPVNARSVPLPRSTAYCSGVSDAFHSASVFVVFSSAIPRA